MDVERLAAKMVCVGFDGLAATAEVRELIARGAGAVVLFKRNFASGQQFADLCAELKEAAGDRPLAVCIDHEGGRVVRLGAPFTQVPSMRALGAVNDVELAREVGALMGRELRAANVDWDFAPVLDVDTNPANPVIGSRSLGRSADVVSRLGVAIIEGLQGAGVAACGKHFPGHGDTAQDSHTDLPRLPHDMARLETVELAPFLAAIGAGVASIMTAHVVFEAIDPSKPATMSEAVLSGLLRGRMGFDGVIVSDDLEMKAIAGRFDFDDVTLSLARAGVDLFCIAHSAKLQHRTIDVLAGAVRRGELDVTVIEGANRRLDRVFERYVKPSTSGALGDIVGCEEHRAIAARVEEVAREHDPTVFIR